MYTTYTRYPIRLYEPLLGWIRVWLELAVSSNAFHVIASAINRMRKTSQPLVLLIEENKIDVHQLLGFFDEALRTEEQFLELTQDIITVQDSERTQDTIELLTKFKKRLAIFCRQNNLLPIKLILPAPGHNKLMNALKFLLLLKEFPLALDELVDDE